MLIDLLVFAQLAQAIPLSQKEGIILDNGHCQARDMTTSSNLFCIAVDGVGVKYCVHDSLLLNLPTRFKENLLLKIITNSTYSSFNLHLTQKLLYSIFFTAGWA
jgi:hypothetical protein